MGLVAFQDMKAMTFTKSALLLYSFYCWCGRYVVSTSCYWKAGKPWISVEVAVDC